MGRIHHWYYLKDKQGRPIVNANLKLYLEGTKTEATIYNSTASSASAIIDQSTWMSGPSGFFDFYIGDQFETDPLSVGATGYNPNQHFDLQWAASAAIYSNDPHPPSGVIDQIQLLPKIFQVDETSTNSIRNKMVSNALAYKWDIHPDQIYSQQPHSLLPVDPSDSTDTTFDKLVNDDLMNRLVSFPIVSAGLPTINTSGALLSQHTLYPSAWAPSGDYGVFMDLDYNLVSRDALGPIVQVYKEDTGDMLNPMDIKFTTDTSLRIVLASAGYGNQYGLGNIIVTVVGETKVRSQAL